MTNHRVGHHCPECDKITEKAQRCRLCGKKVGMINDLCDDCKFGADMNEDLQGLINQKRSVSKMTGDD